MSPRVERQGLAQDAAAQGVPIGGLLQDDGHVGGVLGSDDVQDEWIGGAVLVVVAAGEHGDLLADRVVE